MVQLENGLMTYGEAVIMQKDSLRMVKGEWEADELKRHIRLDCDQALNYYNMKLRVAFGLEPSCGVFYCLDKYKRLGEIA